MASITFTGTRDMQRKLGDISTKMRKNMNRIAEAQAEQIAERAKEYCPVSEDGPIHLVDTIHVEKSGIAQGRDAGGRFSSGADVSVTITAGGRDYPHAVAVHENPSKHDPPTWKGKNINFRVGGPKFLERAMREGVSGVKTAMRRVLS